MPALMTTAIAIYDSDGCIGRCDAKCHDARTADCDCICGGRLHGVGARNALAINAEAIDPDGHLRERFAAANGLDADELRLEYAPEGLFE